MYNKNASDNELIQLYINGETKAIETLLKRHQQRVFSFILMKIKDRNTAEDIFQDTFIKAIDCFNKGKYKEEGKFLPWIMMVAHNLCMDFYRKKKTAPQIINNDGVNMLDYIGFTECYEDEIIKNQTAMQIRDLINLLPKDQKEIVILRHYADMSFKEIAEVSNITLNTALGRMRYAMLNLKKMIGNNKLVVA